MGLSSSAVRGKRVRALLNLDGLDGFVEGRFGFGVFFGQCLECDLDETAISAGDEDLELVIAISC